MTQYDKQFIQDKLFTIELSLRGIEQAVYDMENFTDEEVTDEIKQNFMNIVSSIENIKKIVESQMEKLTYEQ